MKTTLKFIFAIAIMVGFTTNAFSQKKHTAVIIKKHKPVKAKKVVYVKTPKRVTKPSDGTIVFQIPRTATKIVIRNNRYIKHNNVVYSKIKIRGKYAYKVVRHA